MPASVDDRFDSSDLDEPLPVDLGQTPREPTDVPEEWGIVLRDRFWLTCHWRDGGAGAAVMISI